MPSTTFSDHTGTPWHLDLDAIAGAALGRKRAFLLLRDPDRTGPPDPSGAPVRRIRVDRATARRICREIAATEAADTSPRVG